MKATKTMASTATKSAKVIAMAAAVSAAQSIDIDRMAYEQAMADMEQEYGTEHVCRVVYMNPFDNLIA